MHDASAMTMLQYAVLRCSHSYTMLTVQPASGRNCACIWLMATASAICSWQEHSINTHMHAQLQPDAGCTVNIVVGKSQVGHATVWACSIQVWPNKGLHFAMMAKVSALLERDHEAAQYARQALQQLQFTHSDSPVLEEVRQIMFESGRSQEDSMS